MPENIHSLRELCRQRFYVVDMAGDIKRKIIALLDQVLPEYEKLFSDAFGVTSVELLVNYQTPEQMLSVDSTTLADLLQKILSAFYSPPQVFLSSSNNTLSNLKILNPALKFTTLSTANFTQSQELAELLPPLFFLKWVAIFQNLNQCLSSLLTPDFIQKIGNPANP